MKVEVIRTDDTVNHVLRGEEPAIETLHDLTMSERPNIAASSRFLKEAAPIYLRWMNEEHDRGTQNVDIVIATVDIATSLLATCIMNMSDGPDHAAAGTEIVCRAMVARLDNLIKVLRKAKANAADPGDFANPEGETNG